MQFSCSKFLCINYAIHNSVEEKENQSILYIQVDSQDFCSFSFYLASAVTSV